MPEREPPNNTIMTSRRGFVLWKNSGFNFDDSLQIAIAQGCCLGGSTIINDAVCIDPPKRVIDEWKI